MSKRERADAEHMAQWICAVCGQSFVIPTLARDCERKHGKSSTHL